MAHPPAHAFSRSPVQEVFCQVTLGPGAESLSLAIPAPYPGWPHIRDRITDVIADVGEISRITGCMIRYTDLLPFSPGILLPGTAEIELLLSRDYQCETPQGEIVFTSTKIPGTAGSVRSIHLKPEKQGWPLIFTMHTEGPAGFFSSESVVKWFDDARAEIHGLFDLIVPKEIVQLLR